jgi:HAD superfamily hydrolase (TIGR01509 family)
MSATPEVVLLDLGGVIVDVDPEAAGTAWNRLTGRPAAEFETLMFGSGVKYRIDRGLQTEASGLAEVSALTEGEVSADTVRACFNSILSPRPPVAAMVHQLATRCRLAVISNTDPIHGAWCREHGGITDVVEHWTFSFDVRSMKPDRPIYDAVLRAMAVAPNRAVLLDDRRENLESARVLGIDSILFDTLDTVHHQLVARGLLAR